MAAPAAHSSFLWAWGVGSPLPCQVSNLQGEEVVVVERGGAFRRPRRRETVGARKRDALSLSGLLSSSLPVLLVFFQKKREKRRMGPFPLILQAKAIGPR